MSYKRSKDFTIFKKKKIKYLLLSHKSQITVVFFHGIMSDMTGKKPKQIQTFGSDNINIPKWVKNNAEWWADDQIDDSAFVTSLQWLINNDVMEIPDTVQGSSTGTNTIPNWVKNNAEWWADGQIDDKAFVTGIQWLISNGVLKIS